jgi:hypothetical protein
VGSTPIAEGFEGFAATWFYLNRANGTLLESLPATAAFATSADVSVSITPSYFNAPDAAVGSNGQTQFRGQGKPSAYLKAQLDQSKAGSSTKPLSYAALYPIIDNPNDDIGSVAFGDPTTGDPLSGVPLPGGTGAFHTPVTAIVGGSKPKSSLLNIISGVIGLAGGTAAKALFPIPGADLALASNIEALLGGVSTTFAPETKQQYWIDDRAIAVAANQAAAQQADSDVLQLPLGTTLFVMFQLGENDGIEQGIKQIAATQGFTFDIDRGGNLIAMSQGAIVSPNPFANYLYVTYRAIVQAS